MLAKSDFLICLLPLTPETESLIRLKTLRQMKPGGYLINVGRGEHLVEEDLLRKSGANYSYYEVKLGQGRENSKIFLKANPEIMGELEKEIRNKHSKKNAESENVEPSQANFEESGKLNESQEAVATGIDQ